MGTDQLPSRVQMSLLFIEPEGQSSNCMMCEAFTCHDVTGQLRQLWTIPGLQPWTMSVFYVPFIFQLWCWRAIPERHENPLPLPRQFDFWNSIFFKAVTCKLALSYHLNLLLMEPDYILCLFELCFPESDPTLYLNYVSSVNWIRTVYSLHKFWSNP